METNQVTSSTSPAAANTLKKEVKEEMREEEQERKAVATSSTTAPGNAFQEDMDTASTGERVNLIVYQRTTLTKVQTRAHTGNV